MRIKREPSKVRGASCCAPCLVSMRAATCLVRQQAFFLALSALKTSALLESSFTLHTVVLATDHACVASASTEKPESI